MNLIEQIDSILPQTQCKQCGYNGCLEYAKAMAEDSVAINRCPPGGKAGIVKLADILKTAVIEPDLSRGEHVPFETALIDPNLCIGCRLCIDACPTEAIIGARKHLHVVDTRYCNGCCLCQIACPMDCITMQTMDYEWDQTLAAQSRSRFQRKTARKAALEKAREERLEKQSASGIKKSLLASILNKKMVSNESGTEN